MANFFERLAQTYPGTPPAIDDGQSAGTNARGLAHDLLYPPEKPALAPPAGYEYELTQVGTTQARWALVRTGTATQFDDCQQPGDWSDAHYPARPGDGRYNAAIEVAIKLLAPIAGTIELEPEDAPAWDDPGLATPAIEADTVAQISTFKRLCAQIHFSRRIDPMTLYCAKTGQPIGLRDDALFARTLVYTPEGAILAAIDNTNLSCAPQWINTDSAALDVLMDQDRPGYIVYCLALLTRRFYVTKKQAGDVNNRLALSSGTEYYWAKARAYRTIASMPASELAILAAVLGRACALERHTLAVLSLKLQKSYRAPDTLAVIAKAGNLIRHLETAIANATASVIASRNAVSQALPEIEIEQAGASQVIRQKHRNLKRLRERQVLDLAIAGVLDRVMGSTPAFQAEQFLSRLNRVSASVAAEHEAPLFDAIEDARHAAFDLSGIDALFGGDAKDDYSVTVRRIPLEDYAAKAQADYAATIAAREEHALELATRPRGVSILARTFSPRAALPAPAPKIEEPSEPNPTIPVALAPKFLARFMKG